MRHLVLGVLEEERRGQGPRFRDCLSVVQKFLRSQGLWCRACILPAVICYPVRGLLGIEGKRQTVSSCMIYIGESLPVASSDPSFACQNVLQRKSSYAAGRLIRHSDRDNRI